MKESAAQTLSRLHHPLAVFAGLMLAAAFPKFGIAGFAWIAPALLIFAAGETDGRRRFKIGFISGFVCWLASLYWLLLIPVNGLEKIYPFLGWLALSAFTALYLATWVWGMSGKVCKTWSGRNRFALGGAALWVGLEMTRARLLSGFPWNPLGASQYELTPFIHVASVAGVYGVSFLVVWMSLCLYNATQVILREPTRRFAWQAEIALPLGVLIAVFITGFSKLRDTESAADTLRVAFVQPNIAQSRIWNSAEDDRWFANVVKLTKDALNRETDLVLWPEASTPKLIRYDDGVHDAITNIAHTHGVWMIVGSDDAAPASRPAKPGDADYFNASFLINPKGELVSRYCKRNLVIFGEYIPLVRWLPFIKWFTPISGGFEPGDRVVKFELERKPAVRTAALICFEDLFPHLVREYVDDETDFLVNQTNNGWFGESSAQWQHAAAAVFRAVENGVPLLRCSNNGITCWVDEHGRIRQLFHDARGSVYGEGVMFAEIPIRSPGEKPAATFYRRHGDWFGWACAAVSGLVLFARLKSACPDKTPASKTQVEADV